MSDRTFLKRTASKSWRKTYEDKPGHSGKLQTKEYRTAMARVVRRARAELARNHPKEYQRLISLYRIDEGLPYVRKPKR